MIRYLIIAFVSVLISAYYYHRCQPELTLWRKISLLCLRSIAIATILILIVSPVIYYLRTLIERPSVVFLRDVSESMDLLTSNRKKSELLNPTFSALKKSFREKAYNIIEYDFADGIGGNRNNSLLGPALIEISQKHKLEDIHSIVLATDGWLRDESLSSVLQMNVPFCPVIDTTASQIADLKILGVKANKYAYRGEPTLVQAELTTENMAARAKVELLINGKVNAEKQVDLVSEAVQTVEFIHRFPQTGFYSYAIRIGNPQIRERTLNNNIYPGAIEVLNEKEKIYVISDQPGWDNKFIIDALGTNPRWEISHITVKDQKLTANNKAMNSFETTNLSAMVIINNGNLRLGSTLAQEIISLHNRGVGVLYQGLPIAELGEILPIRMSNISSSYSGFLKWRPEAETYPMLKISAQEQGNIPPIDYYYTVPATGATTLVTIDNPQNSAGIVLFELPNRRSIGISFLNLWRWQMQSPEKAYQTMITNIVVWLSSKGRDGFAAITNNSYFKGEKIQIRLRTEDDIRQTKLNISPRMKIIDEKDSIVFDDFMAFENNEYIASLTIDKAGTYRYSIEDKESGKKTSGRFQVAETSMEERDYDFNLPLLSWIAWESGGKTIIDPATYSPPPARSRELTLGYEFSLYRKWYILMLFIMAFSIELFFRRRWGLL